MAAGNWVSIPWFGDTIFVPAVDAQTEATIKKTVQDLAKTNPEIFSGLSTNDVNTLIANYISVHKDELKGLKESDVVSIIAAYITEHKADISGMNQEQVENLINEAIGGALNGTY